MLVIRCRVCGETYQPSRDEIVRGPELVWLPNGAQVTNTEGTRSRLRSRSGNTINVTVYANSWGEFQDSMRARGLAEALY